MEARRERILCSISARFGQALHFSKRIKEFRGRGFGKRDPGVLNVLGTGFFMKGILLAMMALQI